MKITDIFKRDAIKTYDILVEKVKNESIRLEEQVQQKLAQKGNLQVDITNAIAELDFSKAEELQVELNEIEKQIEVKKNFLQKIHPEKSVAVKQAALTAIDDLRKQHLSTIQGEKRACAILINKIKELLDLIEEHEQSNVDYSAHLRKSIHHLTVNFSENEREVQKTKMDGTGYGVNGYQLYPWRFRSNLKRELESFMKDLKKYS